MSHMFQLDDKSENTAVNQFSPLRYHSAANRKTDVGARASHLPHGLGVVLRADLQPADPVLPLFGVGGYRHTNTREDKRERGKKEKQVIRTSLDTLMIVLGIDPSALTPRRQGDNGKHPDQY